MMDWCSPTQIFQVELQAFLVEVDHWDRLVSLRRHVDHAKSILVGHEYIGAMLD